MMTTLKSDFGKSEWKFDIIRPADYTKNGKNVDTVLQEVKNEHEERRYCQLIDKEKFKPNKYKLKCVFLYTKVAGTFFLKPHKNISKNRKQAGTNYNPLIVPGLDRTEDVLLTFTDKTVQSSRLQHHSSKTLKSGQPL